MDAHRRRIVHGLTIDPENPQEIDDGFRVTKIGGIYCVEVSIVDVAAFTGKNSVIDRIARERMKSDYERKVSLFDSRFVRDRMSFIEEERRPGLTVTIPVSRGVKIYPEISIGRTWFYSSANLTYQEAEEILLCPNHSFHHDLNLAKEAAGIIAQSNNGNPLHQQLIMEESNGDGNGNGLNARGIVAEFMVLANKLLAQYCHQHEIPIIYRNFKFYGSRSKARYSPQAIFHDDIGGIYAHFTSPIRRYVDQVNQRSLFNRLEQTAPLYRKRELEKISDCANRQ